MKEKPLLVWYILKLLIKKNEFNFFKIKGTRKDLNSYGTASAKKAPADDNDVDLFGSDEEDEESKRIKAERLAAYAAKKEKSNEFFIS